MEYRVMGVGDDFAVVVEVDEHENMKTFAQAMSMAGARKIVDALNMWERKYG